MIKNKMAMVVGAAMSAALAFGICVPTITANANAAEQSETNIENMDREQLEYARQEIVIALDLLDNADLTNVDNYNRMMAFADAAKQRLEGMESSEEVDSLYSKIGNEIFPSANVALRLMNDMRALQGADKENKEAWINALNEAVTYAKLNNLLNNETLKSAREVLYKEAGLITEDTLLIDGIILEYGISTDLKTLVLFVQHEKSINELINEMNSKCTYTLVDKSRIEGNNKIYKIKLTSKKEAGTEDKLKTYFIELKVDLNNKSVIDKLDTLFKLGDNGSTGGGNKRPSSSTQTIKLKDTVGHWAEGIVNDFVNKGYINGYEDNTFKPNNDITRAEFVTFMNNYLGLTKSSSRVFKDTDGHWAERAIDIAVTNGICKGISNTEFKPNDPITREQASVMISNYKKLSDKNHDKVNKFNDNKDVSSWSKDSVEGMLEKGYMNGYSNNTFKPKSHMTRAEAVVTLSRVK